MAKHISIKHIWTGSLLAFEILLWLKRGRTHIIDMTTPYSIVKSMNCIEDVSSALNNERRPDLSVCMLEEQNHVFCWIGFPFRFFSDVLKKKRKDSKLQLVLICRLIRGQFLYVWPILEFHKQRNAFIKRTARNWIFSSYCCLNNSTQSFKEKEC